MKIDDVIEELQRIRALRGNIEVRALACDYARSFPCNAETAELCDHVSEAVIKA